GSIVASRNAGGAVARRLLIVVVMLPVVGLVTLAGQRAGLYSQPTAAALLALTGFLTAVPALLRTSKALNRFDAAQKDQGRVLEMIAKAAPLAATLDELMRVLEKQADGMLCSILILSDDGKHMRM